MLHLDILLSWLRTGFRYGDISVKMRYVDQKKIMLKGARIKEVLAAEP
jgi:hypothetical protein